MKENFFTENADIQFQMQKRIDWQEMFAWLTPAEKEVLSASNAEDYKQAWLQVLEAFGEVCGGLVAENAAEVDKSKVRWHNGEEVLPAKLQQNITTLKDLGVAAFAVSPEFGGMGAPFIMEMAGGELLNRACPSTMLNLSWFASIAHIIEAFATEDLKNEYIPKIAQGEWSGNMALTEPDAGSDLGALRTYGEQQADGSWKLYGTKRFISNGTSQISLVLAKNSKGAEGLGSLSLYLCPRLLDGQENIKVLKLEDKVGLRASATAELAYDGSTAWLLGKEGEGFQYMLRLMNDSRIGVGFQGLGLMEAAWRLAQDYALTRKTWGKPIAQHELIAELLLDLEVELKASRSLCYQAAFYRSMVALGDRFLRQPDLDASVREEVGKKVAKYKRRLRRCTPLIKYWVGERSYVHARQAMQTLGGYGFTTEYKAEWLVRESLIYSLYEGTSQIQALMCIKDVLKDVVRNPRKFIETALGLRIKSFTDGNPLRKKMYKAKQLSQGAVLSVLLKLVKTNAKANFATLSDADLFSMIKKLSRELIKFDKLSPAFLHAERICEIKCLEALCEVLVWDAEADTERTWVAERFMHKALPRMHYLKALIDEDDHVIAERLAQWQ